MMHLAPGNKITTQKWQERWATKKASPIRSKGFNYPIFKLLINEAVWELWDDYPNDESQVSDLASGRHPFIRASTPRVFCFCCGSTNQSCPLKSTEKLCLNTKTHHSIRSLNFPQGCTAVASCDIHISCCSQRRSELTMWNPRRREKKNQTRVQSNQCYATWSPIR
jgi:hypothetical protein